MSRKIRFVGTHKQKFAVCFSQNEKILLEKISFPENCNPLLWKYTTNENYKQTFQKLASISANQWFPKFFR